MTPGIYDNISNAEYHGGPGISNSGLSLVRRSPLHYRARMLAANDNNPTAAQAIGTAFHALILEPELFVQQYTLGLRQSDYPDAIDSSEQLRAMVADLNKTRLPKLATSGSKLDLINRIAEQVQPADREAVITSLAADSVVELKATIDEFNKTRAGLLPTTGTIPQLTEALRANGVAVKLWSDIKAEWMANNGHRTVLDPEGWDQLHRMREAVMAHPAARALLTSVPGKAEQSVYWIDKETGMLCRCRPDFWRDDDVLVDLKTTEDASPTAFAKSIDNYAYDTQDAFYTDGCAAVGRPLKAFVFLAVEKSACVIDGVAKGVAVYRLDDISRDIGRAKYKADLRRLAECERTNVWPCYGDKIQTISVPQYALNRNQHLLDAALA